MLIFCAIQYILKKLETNSKSVNTVVELPIGFARGIIRWHCLYMDKLNETLPLWFIAYQDIP